MTKNEKLPANLIRLLLIIAGVEQNPGPWFCNICTKRLTSYAIQCDCCLQWIHVKCSRLKSIKERQKFNTWHGPCCQQQPPPPTPPHGPPPPCPPQPPSADVNNCNLNILQYNINGISGKLDELLHFIEKEDIKIAAIQETKLTKKSVLPNINNFNLVRKDRGTNKGGGVAFLVHEDIPFQLEETPNALKNDPHTESITISIPGQNKPLKIRNVYIPPTSSCTSDYRPPINHLFSDLPDTSLVLGDLNAHHELWYSEDSSDLRGRDIADNISGTNFGIINEDLPTRIVSNSSTAPDISFASSNLIPCTTWRAENKMKSDHLPIIISLTADIKKTRTKKHTYINFEKADWEGFKTCTEEIFANARPIGDEDKDIHEAEKFFRKTIQKAAGKHIPAGRIPKAYNALPRDAAVLIEERDQIKKQNPGDIRIPELNNNIDKLTKEHRKKKWTEHLSKCQQGSKKLWKTIKGLSNIPKQPENQGIKFNNKITNDPKLMAKKFNSQYTPSSDKKPDQRLRNYLRKLKKPKGSKVNFTPSQVKKAIQKSKSSKALGPDEISPIMLKNIGPHGINFLTELYNRSINSGVIPRIWKQGKIIPLLKPGKPADQGSSYRPISLLSPLAKILEALLLPSLNDSIKLIDHQHGFRKARSTTTALQDIKNHITTGLNKKPPVNRTVSVAIDLSKAFDTVDHQLLLKDILDLQLNEYIKRFLCSYLRGRQTYVIFRGSKSPLRKMKQGVPQGGVLSPILFNLYMSKMPLPPGNIRLVSYADDSNVLNSGIEIPEVCEEINIYLDTLDNWFKSRNLFISPSKSSATLFTTGPNECNTVLPIKINGEQVPTIKKPTFLGITFDNLLSFKQHVENLKSKVQARNNILKALSGSDWGKDKETITNTYKAIGQSVISYGCPIWTPALGKTSWNHLQIAQNSALKIATGCHKIASSDHVHQETEMMPVKDRCYMLSKQFLLATQTQNHPNYTDLSAPPPPRVTKPTLATCFGDEIRQLSTPNMVQTTYKKALKTIHTNSVRDTINNLGNNRVLNARPPKINKAEKELPRTTRSTLSQLRSGFSKHLNSYKNRLDPSFSDKCDKCNTATHTTEHLFLCPQNPTQLTVRDLWQKPKQAARFLGLPHDDNG